MHKTLFRLLGIATIAAGTILWARGGILYPVSNRGFSFSLPIHFILIFLGMWGTVWPLTMFHVCAVALPGPLGRRARELSDEFALEANSYQVPAAEAAPEAIARGVRRFIVAYHRRYNLTVAAFGAFLLVASVCLPFLITDLVADSSYRRHAERIAKEVQQSNLEFINFDHFRETLSSAAPAIDAFGERPTATRLLFDALEIVFASSVKTSGDLDAAFRSLYRSRVEPATNPSTGLLDLGRIELAEDPKLDPTIVLPSYLTLLANSAIRQGDQGRYVDPYLQARQLLRRALQLSDDRNLLLPATNNSLGLSYSSLLVCYDQYERKFQTSETQAAIATLLDEDAKLRMVTLALFADSEFSLAADSSTKNFAIARYLNNKVDLRIQLLRLVHIQNESPPVTNAAEEAFLLDELAYPVGSHHVDRIESILTRLQSDIARAISLASLPELFFTRAQLLSIGGEIAERAGATSPAWTDAVFLKESARKDLIVAESLGVPAVFFTAEELNRLGLSWTIRSETRSGSQHN